MIGLACNEAEMHQAWIKDIQHFAKLDESKKFPYPIIDDHSRQIAKLLGIIDPAEADNMGNALTARALFIIGPDKKMKLSILYPATTGRNFDEVLRVIDSLQLCAKHRVATPVDWKNGGKCMVQPTVKPEEIETLFPQGVEIIPLPSKKEYLRMTEQPTL